MQQFWSEIFNKLVTGQENRLPFDEKNSVRYKISFYFLFLSVTSATTTTTTTASPGKMCDHTMYSDQVVVNSFEPCFWFHIAAARLYHNDSGLTEDSVCRSVTLVKDWLGYMYTIRLKDLLL